MSLEIIPQRPTISNIGVGFSLANIFRQNELTVTSKNETDISSTSYTVASGKKFIITSFVASYDSPSFIIIRLKKQTGGAGNFNQVLKITLQVGGQGQGTVPLDLSTGVYIGDVGDVFKMTYEASLIKGIIWACYSGIEL